MKTLIIILSALSIFLLLSTLICGLWIRSAGEAVDQSSIEFHMKIALVAIGVTLSSLILAAARVWQFAA